LSGIEEPAPIRKQPPDQLKFPKKRFTNFAEHVLMTRKIRETFSVLPEFFISQISGEVFFSLRK